MFFNYYCVMDSIMVATIPLFPSDVREHIRCGCFPFVVWRFISPRIWLLKYSSCSRVDQVKATAKDKKVMVLLDSSHKESHVKVRHGSLSRAVTVHAPFRL